MRKFSNAALAIALCSVSAIGWTALEPRAMAAANQAPLVTVDKGSSSGIREQLQVVISSEAEWEAFWKRHRANQLSPAASPPVNFSMDMVVGVFLGEKSTGGYEVEITRAEQAETGLRVYYREKSPPWGAIVIEALTQPYHLVRLPKSDARVLFQREKS